MAFKIPIRAFVRRIQRCGGMIVKPAREVAAVVIERVMNEPIEPGGVCVS